MPIYESFNRIPLKMHRPRLVLHAHMAHGKTASNCGRSGHRI